MDKEILNLARKKGLLIEKEIFEILKEINNSSVAENFLENLERISGKKLITKEVLMTNSEYVQSFISHLKDTEKNTIERICVNFGISFEVKREKITLNSQAVQSQTATNTKYTPPKYKIKCADTNPEKKLEVKDFVEHFRSRFHQLQKILMSRPEVQKNLVSINKISSERSSLTIIGIVLDKKITKNKNILLTIEDNTGQIKALVKSDREETYQKADELQLDDIIALKVSGNRDMLYVHEVIFPDSMLFEKTKFENEQYLAFLSDIHCGSDRHLKNSFLKFISWLNSDDQIASKINYIFFTGDNVDGVGIFPGQENALELKSMKEQYALLASYIRKIPERITLFMCPGQHDACRVAEPQPLIAKKYAPELYNIENLVLVTNPAMVEILEGDKIFRVLMYHGASIHYLINEIKPLRLMKAHRCPAKAVIHMLKRRHLAPTHSEVVYIPNAQHDPLVINEVPDVLCTGEVHRLDVQNYNGTLIITGSCWQSQTPFEEKVGNIPDPAKVPVLNLKTRELKIFDFAEEETK